MNLYLIDGTNYIYRAFHAIRELRNSKGFPTNAIYGFINMLLKIVRDRKPDAIAVVFDSPEPTEKHRLFAEYKAHRPPPPDDLIQQIDPIKDVVDAMSINTYAISGFEADDILGTIAKKAASEETKVYIATGDKDLLQVIDSNIRIYDPMKNEEFDSNYVIDRYGIPPERFYEYISLTGDPVDNIPGAKGIGEKTAKMLLKEFSSLDDLTNNTDKIHKERIRTLIENSIESINISKELALINYDLPVEIDISEAILKVPDYKRLKEIFTELEFSSLLKDLPKDKDYSDITEIIRDKKRLKEILSAEISEISIDTETTGNNPFTDRIVGISFSLDGEKGYYIPVAHKGEVGPQLSIDTIKESFSKILADKDIIKVCHNIKFDMHILRRYSLNIKGYVYDTMLASYLLNPNKLNHNLDDASIEYLSFKKTTFKELLGKRNSFDELSIEEASVYSVEDSVITMKLKEILFEMLKDKGMTDLYNEIEMPLIYVLGDIERNGLKIDTKRLKELSIKLKTRIDSIVEQIYSYAGEEFNINSPKQLSDILFVKLKLSPGKKTKTGYSTNTNVLESLTDQHPLPEAILHYRTLTKLKNTYIDILPDYINPETGRLHTSFNQTVASTGRLSSSSPNLQNIPIRGEWGEKIRKAFIADNGNLLVSADYSQIELRILAHLSNDRGLIDAFKKGRDIHTEAARDIFGLDKDDNINGEMRRIAKIVNFGIIYGISPYGLSETLKIQQEEAKRYIDTYFRNHEGVKRYIDKTIEDTTDKGYSITMGGRIRPIPELKSSDKNRRLQAQRLAINSPIQGSAADVIKIAMIRIHKRIEEANYDSRMVLQIHDELLFEVPEKELDPIIELVKYEMEHSIKLSVPLKVDIGYGRSWAEAH